MFRVVKSISTVAVIDPIPSGVFIVSDFRASTFRLFELSANLYLSAPQLIQIKASYNSSNSCSVKSVLCSFSLYSFFKTRDFYLMVNCNCADCTHSSLI